MAVSSSSARLSGSTRSTDAAWKVSLDACALVAGTV